MEWLDALATVLPARREDEPPDLRRKILAELCDHLHSAMQRELLLTGSAKPYVTVAQNMQPCRAVRLRVQPCASRPTPRGCTRSSTARAGVGWPTSR